MKKIIYVILLITSIFVIRFAFILTGNTLHGLVDIDDSNKSYIYTVNTDSEEEYDVTIYNLLGMKLTESSITSKESITNGVIHTTYAHYDEETNKKYKILSLMYTSESEDDFYFSHKPINIIYNQTDKRLESTNDLAKNTETFGYGLYSVFDDLTGIYITDKSMGASYSREQGDYFVNLSVYKNGKELGKFEWVFQKGNQELEYEEKFFNNKLVNMSSLEINRTVVGEYDCFIPMVNYFEYNDETKIMNRVEETTIAFCDVDGEYQIKDAYYKAKTEFFDLENFSSGVYSSSKGIKW
jgi:hypothetical protein